MNVIFIQPDYTYPEKQEHEAKLRRINNVELFSYWRIVRELHIRGQLEDVWKWEQVQIEIERRQNV